MLDSAASPASITSVLRTIRATLKGSGRLLVVVGVLGSPEPTQLCEIGVAAAELADKLLLTAGSLRRKPPVAPIEGLAAGAALVPGALVEVIPQRRAAIGEALKEMRFVGTDVEVMELHLRLGPRQRSRPFERGCVAMLVNKVQHRLA